MIRLRMLGLALVAVFAMGAVAASAASAAPPEYLNAKGETPTFKCEEKTGGRGEYSTKAICEEPEGKRTAGGKWQRFGTNGLTSTSGASYLEASSEKISCTADSDKGELTGAKTDLVRVTFTGCTAKSGLAKCQNTSTKGEIQTNWLFSKLGFIKGVAPIEVGLSLTPETKGGLFAEFTCEALGIKEVVKVGEGTGAGGNSIIGKMEPIGKVVTPPATFSLSLKCSKANTQEFEKFEGGTIDVLESKVGSGSWERSCQNTGTDTILLEEAGEITE